MIAIQELQAKLEMLDMQLFIDGDDLEWDAPDDVVVPDELLEALRAHKAMLMAYLIRREKCRWPCEMQIAWGRAANRLERERGLRFPESEIRAYTEIYSRVGAMP